MGLIQAGTHGMCRAWRPQRGLVRNKPTAIRSIRFLGIAVIGLCCALFVTAAAPDSARAQQADGGGEDAPTDAVSPVRQIERATDLRSASRPRPPDQNPLIRSIDGSGNNVRNPEWGAANTQLRRLMASDYGGDGAYEMAGAGRPGPREISNMVHDQAGSHPNDRRASDYVWQWGQFLDHDIDLTDGVDPPEWFPITTPPDDPYFFGTEMQFNRSIHDPSSGTGANNPRQQMNEVTTWIDASNVYGSDSARAAALRENDGSGKLKTSASNFLPFNTGGLPNAGGSAPTLYLAGDVRANEQVGLTALHTLFMREHNRLAEEIFADDPSLSGDEIYERARRLVGAQMQIITYEEFLPALLGRRALTRYRGYKRNVDARIMNIFSTATYRLGHSMLNSELQRLNPDGTEYSDGHGGHLALRDAFFAPHLMSNEGQLASILRGLAAQPARAIDPSIVDAVRNFLFGDPGSGGFDLASLNIQRGRDHGLPSYNDARRALRLRPARGFEDVSSDPAIQARLDEAYDTVEDIDVWVGGLCEDHVRGALVGELFHKVLVKQFSFLRDGDRFWYEIALNRDELRQVRRTRLSDVIRRNTEVDELPDNVFRVSNDD